MQKAFTKHARLIAVIQLFSALTLGGCSIWYGAWYPDAQSKLHEKIKIDAPAVAKPGFWDVSLSDVGFATPVAYTGLALLLGLISGFGVVVSAKRLEELEGREAGFKLEQESHSETQKYYYEALKDHLISFFCTQIEGFDTTCRASVYRHDSKVKLFRMVFRYSKITRFAEKGRVSLPEQEGVVGAIYSNGDSLYVSQLPAKISSSGYCKRMNKELEGYGVSIQQATLAKLRMSSRCYYGYAIRDVSSGEKFAILVIESTSPDKFKEAEITEILSSQSAKISKYVRHIAHIDSKLNPYGVA